MNICLRDALRPLFAAIILVPSAVVASDFTPTETAYQHYRCDALVEMNRMTDSDQLVCDELKSNGFDLAAWEADNRDASIKLHEEVFSEFF